MVLRAVGFDVDGTLYPNNRAFWRSILYIIRHIRAISAFSRTRRIMREQEEDQAMAGDASETEIGVFAQQLRCSPERAERIRRGIIYSGLEKCLRRLKTYKGVRESLISLKKAGLKIAALSDFPIGRKLQIFGLDDLFDVALGYPETLRLKPRPEPFLLMARKLGVLPEEILYIGNKFHYDVRGAENAGMRGALVGPVTRHVPQGVTSYANFQDLAERILFEVKK